MSNTPDPQAGQTANTGPAVDAAVVGPPPPPAANRATSELTPWHYRHAATAAALGKSIAIMLLGLVLPIVLLAQAYQAMSTVDTMFQQNEGISAISKALPAPIQAFRTANDYAMLAMVFIESSNQRMMIHKQRMKTAVMHIGFAVISIGLLLIVLGIDAGGVEVAGGMKEGFPPINIKVASTGVLVFLLGAAMSAAGGLLPNSYTTVGMPGFIYSADTPATASFDEEKKERFASLQKECEAKFRTEKELTGCLARAQDIVYKRKD